MLPPPALSMDSGLSLCNGLLIKLFQAAHMRRKSTFRCGPQELSASGKIFRRLALYINNSRHLARKYARIFVRGHYLFREANSFPKAKLEENYEIRGTDNVQGQISSLFSSPFEAIVFIFLQFFSATCAVFKIGGYSRIFPSFNFSILHYPNGQTPSSTELKM